MPEQQFSNRGFTLLEGVFSIFLIFLVLSSLTYTLKQAGAVKANTKNLDRMTEVFHTLVLIKSDARAATNIVEPSSGTSNRLELTRVDKDRDFFDRIGLDQSEDPFDSSKQSRVAYQLDDGLLRRQIVTSQGVETLDRLIRVTDFEVSRQDRPNVLTLTLEIEKTRVRKRHSIKVAFSE